MTFCRSFRTLAIVCESKSRRASFNVNDSAAAMSPAARAFCLLSLTRSSVRNVAIGKAARFSITVMMVVLDGKVSSGELMREGLQADALDGLQGRYVTALQS